MSSVFLSVVRELDGWLSCKTLMNKAVEADSLLERGVIVHMIGLHIR